MSSETDRKQRQFQAVEQEMAFRRLAQGLPFLHLTIVFSPSEITF